MKKIMNFVARKWIDPEAYDSLDVENLSTGEILGYVPLSTTAEANRTIASSTATFAPWRRIPVATKAGKLLRFRELLFGRRGELKQCIAREAGKTKYAVQAEMKRTLLNLEAACEMPMLTRGEPDEGITFGLYGEFIRQFIGVFGIIPHSTTPPWCPFGSSLRDRGGEYRRSKTLGACSAH
jgi:malonate-semialdehyde dehydrogenase (acetylating)/methylmalonate-semialdehyde dehydrogenase